MLKTCYNNIFILLHLITDLFPVLQSEDKLTKPYPDVQKLPQNVWSSFLIFKTHQRKTKFTEKHDFHIVCLIKKLSKMPRFVRFTLVNAIEFSLFRCFRKIFFDGFLNLLQCMTFWQNVFSDADFLNLLQM